MTRIRKDLYHVTLSSEDPQRLHCQVGRRGCAFANVLLQKRVEACCEVALVNRALVERHETGPRGVTAGGVAQSMTNQTVSCRS